MTPAYDKLYLEKAKNTLGCMLNYAVNILDFSIEDFYKMFLKSNISKLFQKGNCSIIAGKSGIELVYSILQENNLQISFKKNDQILLATKEYWTGMVLAYFQWQSCLSFEEIEKVVPIKKIVELYYPYHEMDIRQFVDKMNELLGSVA